MGYHERGIETLEDTKRGVYYKVWFRGFISDVSRNGDYAFIAYDSIGRVDGESLGVHLHGDIRMHIKKNPKLGDPLPRHTWVLFLLGPDKRSRDGIEAISGEFD